MLKPMTAAMRLLPTSQRTTETTARETRYIDVTPLYETVRASVPRRMCWKERVVAIQASGARFARRCVSERSDIDREEPTGYCVKYRCLGRIGHAHSPRHPGERILVRYRPPPSHF